MMSKKIRRQALELKCLVQKSMSLESLEKATSHLNGILAECDRVEEFELVAVIPPKEAA